ncbi:MAG: PAS domain-containing protein [Acidovorax sp.]
MGARIRAFDWSTTRLGPIAHWPASLRIAVDMLLASDFPACLFWGADLIAIYNDGYHTILGGKGEALGQPLRVTWSEAWDGLKPIAEKALAGESTFIEDFEMHIDRGGAALEEAFFTFCYSPWFDEHGAIVAMLDTVVETTDKVLAERKARSERARQQRLLQQMPGFVGVLMGPEHRFEYVNDAYVKISGPRDFLGRTVREVFPELRGQGYYEMLDRVYATGEPMQASAMPILLQGEANERHIDILYEAMRDEGGSIHGIFVGGYDVTERVQAQAAAQASEARLRALNADLERQVIERTLSRGRAWAVSPELLCVINASGHFEAANPAWERTLGWTEEEMQRMGFRDLVHPDDLASSERAWADASERGLPVLRFENRYRAKAGGWRWLSWVAVPEEGLVYCITRDVQDEKDHAAALAERTAERDVLATIVQTTDAFIQVLDRDYRFLATNQANADEFERVYGVRPALGDSLPALLAGAGADAREALALWQRAMAGESFTVQGRFGNPAIAVRQYELKFEVLRAADGTQIGAFATGVDITDKLRQKAAFDEAQEALRQAQKMEAVGQLTGGIAHDFNNLLAAMSGSLQVMKMHMAKGRREGMERYVEMCERSVRSAASLTQRLLAFSRRQTLDPRPVDVNRLVAGMQDLIARTVGPTVELRVAAAPDLWAARIDPSQLESALLNLCINARDAMMPQGGRLAIATANQVLDERSARELELPPGEYLVLSVADTGAGMPPELVQRIFDPFFTTKPLGQGTGLGLSMVYGFVRQSGGQVRVQSAPGQGTTMALYLPRHQGSAAEHDAGPAPDALTPGAGETVLVIEDEETIRALVSEVLAEAGYRVLLADSGPTGLHLLQGTERIDLLVTDVGLPGGLNGRQVADAGRSVRPGLKVLFITGYAENAAVGNGLMEDGMAILTKPFDVVQLAHRVRQMLDGGAGPS